MAAPSGIVWGSIVGSYGKIGIYVKLTQSNTEVDRHIEVWFASKYSVSDSSNTVYWDCGADVTSATTSRGSKSISHTVDTGDGWSTSNQTKIYEGDYTYTRGTSAKTYKCYSKFTNIDRVGGTMYANTSFTIPALTSYTITYNANGGSGAPSSQTKYYGKDLTLSSTKPTRSGYTFKGWATSSTATSAKYQAGGTYTANAKATLYAVWEASSYAVTLTKGTGISSVTGAGTYSTGDSVTINATVSSGYTWKNWTGYTTTTTRNYTFTMPAKAVSLTANATANTYTISFNANGGGGAPSAQTKTHGVTLTLSSTRPTRDGYTFKGWGTSASDTTADYQPGGSYTGNANATLYAVWEQDAPTTYTISYNANGGSGAPSSQIKTYGVTLTLSSTKPTRTGYTFKNWNTNSYGYGTSYSPGGSYTANANATLYAQWDPITYIVSYNANGGSGIPSNQTKTYGVTLKLSNTQPTRDGYTFKGWGTSSTDTTADYQPGGNYTANAAITLYAIWEKNAANTYTVSYNANGGSGAPANQTKTQGTALTLSSTRPTRDGYTFKGWGTSSTDTTVDYQPGGTYTTDANITLYAIWEENAPTTYIVSYNANGGSGAPSAQTKTHGVALTLSSTVPVYSGYTFKGWGTSASDTTADYQPGGIYTTDAAITLYAIWEKNSSSTTTGKVYICIDNSIYANDFITSSSIYIDSSGNFYAPAFTTGNSVYISSSGVVARAFIKGTP